MAKYINSNVIDFSQYMERTESAQNVFKPSDYLDDVLDYFQNGQGNQGVPLPWENTQDKIRFRESEISIWVGMNGHGKSMLLGQIALGFHVCKQKTCIASLEMKPKITLARMWRQAAMTNKPTPAQIKSLHAVTDDTLRLYDQQGSVKAETMLGVMRYCAEVEQCQQFILDSFMKCGINEEDNDRQKWFIGQICTIAKDTGMHIHVVTHSRKMFNEDSPPRKMDVKGSGAITDQADNVIVWWKNKKKEDAKMKAEKGLDAEKNSMTRIRIT
jgi:twinkle protein